jgi:hypothetical protein
LLLRAYATASLAILEAIPGALARFGHDRRGLVAEGFRDLFVCGKHLFRRKNLLAITGRVRGDLRGLRSAVTRAFEVILDLLGARARRVEVGVRVALDLGRAALAGLDLVSEIAKLMGQRGLVDSRREVLRFEETLRLESPG